MARGRREPLCSCRLSGQWIDLVHGRRPPRGIVLDMDSSVSPTHGEQENSVWNGHYACTCYHPLFVFNQFGDLERCSLRPGNVHSADGWDGCAQAGRGTLPGQGLAHLFPGRRGLRQSRGLRVSRSRADQIRDPAAGEPHPARTGSATCSSARSGDLRTKCGGSMRISPIRPEAGPSRAA